MRSALWQAIDIIGPDASPEDLKVLAHVIADLMRNHHLATRESLPAWRAAIGAGDGPGRIRAIMATAPASFLLDGTEPELVLRRLGWGGSTSRGTPSGD